MDLLCRSPFLALLFALSAFPGPALAADSAVPDLSFKDIRYLPRTLEDLGEKRLYVLAFFTVGDPASDKCLRRMQALAPAAENHVVQPLGMNVGPGDSIKRVALKSLNLGLQFPVVKDMDDAWAPAVGVTHTPAVVVLDQERRLRFRGTADGAVQAVRALLAEESPPAFEPIDGGRPVTQYTPPSFDFRVTYAEHIAPIFFEHCAECHRPGRAAPFSLLNYKQAAGQAAMIAEVVREGRMPPWYATEDHAAFTNSRALPARDRKLITAWVAEGAEAGDLEAAPAPPEFPKTKWGIGEPDLVVEAEEPDELPATGFVDYEYKLLPYTVDEDMWVSGIEVHNSNPRVVHHLAFGPVERRGDGKRYIRYMRGQAVGTPPLVLPPGYAILLPEGMQFGVVIHYVTTGKPQKNLASVGLRFPREPVKQRVFTKFINAEDLEIPPGALKHEETVMTPVSTEISILSMLGHMHLRGRDFYVEALLPDRSRRRLLVVPNYNFDWQLAYELAPGDVVLPKGSRVRFTAHFDNSAFNAYNPDPGTTVKLGPQTVDEMMELHVLYTDQTETLHVEVDPATGHVVSELQS